MSFALNGTHIDGGTFNNVAGNMTQVLNSHVSNSHARISAGTERGERKQGLMSSTTGSIGAIRGDRVSRHRNGEPYGIADRRHRHEHHQSELPHRNSNSTSSYDVQASRATIAPSQYNTRSVYATNNEAISAFNSAQLQESSPFYQSAISNGYGRSWSNVPEGHDVIPAPVQYDLVPTYSGTQENISVDGSEPRPAARLGHHSMLPYQAPSIFPEIISNNTYNSIGGNMTQVYGESGIDILYRYVVMEALHDSGERFPEPACHPGTRTEILEELRSWSTDINPDSTILWLHGSAGMGKSAIAQMFAGHCQQEGRLGASFFFRRGHPKRGTWNGLITTIAYQLAKSVPEFLSPLQEAMEADKLIVGRTIPVQFERLLMEPFRHAATPQIIPVIVLDGLDECADHTVQQRILGLFIGSIRAHQLPIRLLIISRPEPHLREVLETKETLSICRPLALSADDSAYEDIRKYLQDEFSRIHSAYLVRGIDLGAIWPISDALNHLVRKSSGIFIYATTVIRFISDEYSHPEDRLASVLHLDPQSTAPLDDLYTQILSVLPQECLQFRILHAIWKSIIPGGLDLNPEDIDMLLELRAGTSRLILRGLYSLFTIPPISSKFSLWQPISFLHASLSDYLGDSRRSGPWCVSLPWLQTEYVHCLIRLLSSPLPTEFTSGDRVRIFYSNAVYALSTILRNTTPSDDLIGLMRHKEFQHSLFYVQPLMPGPQRDSCYPSDLIQLWEGHRYIFDLTSDLKLNTNRSTPTFRFDAIYTEIFSNHPDLVFVLQTMVFLPLHHREILRILGPTWNDQAFMPFHEFRDQLALPFPDGDSPLDFLSDYRRAGHIYSDPRNAAEELVLLWIYRVKELLSSGGLFWISGVLILDRIDRWPRRPRIVLELETLDLSGLCHQMAIDPEAHKLAHEYGILRPNIYRILDWLQDFPDPPLRAITIWERQIEAIKRCARSNDWESDSDSEESNSDSESDSL
ncbi:hypothetical protein C8R44DRAFT_983337 [Mycena epipterygia]|nr:hypothetical protein C8R44DRAFT_983337 [Mycena epipterygia]